MKLTAIILLAGESKRFGLGSKQLFKLHHKPLFYYSLKAFEESPLINDIILVCSKSNIEQINNLIKKYQFHKIENIILGGLTRSESVKNGIFSIKDPQESDGVLIHDSARPLLSNEMITRLADALRSSEGVIPIIDSYDSLISIKNKIEYIDRESIKRVQTPQAFNVLKLQEVMKNHWDKDATDEGVLFNKYYKLTFVKGDERLIKVTTINDIKQIKELMKK